MEKLLLLSTKYIYKVITLFIIGMFEGVENGETIYSLSAKIPKEHFTRLRINAVSPGPFYKNFLGIVFTSFR